MIEVNREIMSIVDSEGCPMPLCIKPNFEVVVSGDVWRGNIQLILAEQSLKCDVTAVSMPKIYLLRRRLENRQISSYAEHDAGVATGCDGNSLSLTSTIS